MQRRLTDASLSLLSTFIASVMGLHFPRARWDDLERQIQVAAKVFEFDDLDTFIQWIISSPLSQESIEKLATHLTISETYFWREPKTFEALCEEILPALTRLRQKSQKRLRIWSAGCSTGEEPYSIAMALFNLIPDISNWNITILATDINPQSLHKAEVGEYSEWSFRNEPSWLKTRYFSVSKNNKYKICSEIRNAVTFQYLNLTEDVYPSLINNTSAMDIIFCRNVLMYFTTELALLVGQRFYNSLIDGGWLFVSACELSNELFPQFSSVQFTGTTAYQRTLTGRKYQIERSVSNQVERSSLKRTSKEIDGMVRLPQITRKQENVSSIKPIVIKTLSINSETSARSLANQGKLDEAIFACEQALIANKLDVGHYYLLANILQEQKRDNEAIAAFKQVLYLDHNFVMAYFALGKLELQHGKIGVANKYFENALDLLSNYNTEDILPEAEGLTTGRLAEIIHAILMKGAR